MLVLFTIFLVIAWGALLSLKTPQRYQYLLGFVTGLIVGCLTWIIGM